MKRLLTVVALILSGFSGFGQEPDLVEGAKRAIAYWHSLYLQCGSDQNQSGPWYGVEVEEGPARAGF